jgi:hypothetical protein
LRLEDAREDLSRRRVVQSVSITESGRSLLASVQFPSPDFDNRNACEPVSREALDVMLSRTRKLVAPSMSTSRVR